MNWGVQKLNTAVWMLIVDHDAEIVTTVQASEYDAKKRLFDNFDPFDYGGDVQALIDREYLIVHIDPHKLILS